MFLFFNIFFILAGYVDYKDLFNNREFLYRWLTMGLFYPLLLSSILNTGARSLTITVGDFDNIPNFREKLLTIATQEYAIITEEPNEIVLKPTSWFYKMTGWIGSENFSIQWKNDEVIISGSQKKVSSIEGSLTWNKMFKV